MFYHINLAITALPIIMTSVVAFRSTGLWAVNNGLHHVKSSFQFNFGIQMSAAMSSSSSPTSAIEQDVPMSIENTGKPFANKQVVFIRHGESEWNTENRFTGWSDVQLTENGYNEAKDAGKFLAQEGFEFDVVYTSMLKRAINTTQTVLKEMDLLHIPIHKHWRLNERHYGALQGFNKAEIEEKLGSNLVQKWRKDFHSVPPLFDEDAPYRPEHYDRYSVLSPEEKTKALSVRGESLHMTQERILPVWRDQILKDIADGKRVLVVAHSNTLRSLLAHVEDMSSQQLLKFKVPTGKPILYHLDEYVPPHMRGGKHFDEALARAAAEEEAEEADDFRKSSKMGGYGANNLSSSHATNSFIPTSVHRGSRTAHLHHVSEVVGCTSASARAMTTGGSNHQSTSSSPYRWRKKNNDGSPLSMGHFLM